MYLEELVLVVLLDTGGSTLESLEGTQSVFVEAPLSFEQLNKNDC